MMPEIEEQIQGWVPSWRKSKKAHNAFIERFRVMRKLDKASLSGSSKQLLIALLAMVTDEELPKAAGRIQKARQTDAFVPKDGSSALEKVLYLARIELIDKELLPYASESLAHMPDKYKSRLSRLVRQPESFL
jgi:hypothetical protein